MYKNISIFNIGILMDLNEFQMQAFVSNFVYFPVLLKSKQFFT